MGKDGGWSLAETLKSLSKNSDIPSQVRKDLEHKLKDIDNAIKGLEPKKPGKSLGEDIGDWSEKGALYGSVGGFFLGGAYGAMGFAAGPVGLATVSASAVTVGGAGAAAGAAIGAVGGALKHFLS